MTPRTRRVLLIFTLIYFAAVTAYVVAVATGYLVVFEDGSFTLGPFSGCAVPSWGCTPPLLD